MPVSVIRIWQAERDAWLRQNGVEPSRPDWRSHLGNWPAQRLRDFRKYVSDRWLDHLDALHGECVLRRPECARTVAESLHHFDCVPHTRTPHAPREPVARTPHAPRELLPATRPHAEREEYNREECTSGRYYLSDYVVMPNHVHILVAFPTEEAMLKQCESWKHYTARQINGLLQRRGRLWQQDAFDHLVRSPDEFDRLRAYIADNPRAAGLRSDEYLHYQKD